MEGGLVLGIGMTTADFPLILIEMYKMLSPAFTTWYEPTYERHRYCLHFSTTSIMFHKKCTTIFPFVDDLEEVIAMEVLPTPQKTAVAWADMTSLAGSQER